MVMWPTVALGIITFQRPAEIRQTLAALANNLSYAGKMILIVADDCTPGRYRQDLEQWWADYYPGHWPMKVLTTPFNGGWGANANNLLDYAFNVEGAKYLYMQEDDYLLCHPLNLTLGVALLEMTPTMGMLRYRATAGAPMIYFQHEADISSYLPDYREYLGYTLGHVTWLELLGKSPTLWLYSNGPHLKRREFHDVYGLYPERVKLGICEETYAHMVQDMLLSHPNAPKIGVLPEWVYMKFDHIGVSYQGTEYDK